MSILYSSNASEPFETRDLEYKVDPWNMDTGSRVFAMRKQDRTRFERGLRKNLSDSRLVSGGFPTMYVMNWAFSLTPNQAWYICMIELGGLVDGIIREPVISGSITAQSVQAQSLDGTQVEIDYYSPTWTYRYAATSRPTTRRFPTGILPTDFDLQIFGRRGSRSGNARTSGINGEVTADYYLQRQTFTPTFDPVQVGKYWQVTESVQLRLIESNLLGFSHNAA